MREKNNSSSVVLTEAESSTLRQIYGFSLMISGDTLNPKLEGIRTVSEKEQYFFSNDGFLSPYFTVQQLYKVHGNISPVLFNLAVYRLIEANPNLRANYCRMPERVLKVIFTEQTETPRILYRNLRDLPPDEINHMLDKIMEADMRQRFELAHGPLFRISVLRTASDEYAVLVTALQLVADDVDIAAALCDAQKIPKSSKESTDSFASYIEAQKSVIAEPVVQYWKKVLANLPPRPELPFYRHMNSAYEQKAYRANIPAEDMALLQKAAKQNRNMAVTILQIAWGLLLQEENKSRDTYYCMMIPGRQEEEGKTGDSTMMPVRLSCKMEDSISSVIQQGLRQFVISQPYSCIQRASLLGLLKQKSDSLHHILNFDGFAIKPSNFSEGQGTPEGNLITRNTWDAQGMPLGIYFHSLEQTIAISFLYNQYNFLPQGILAMAKRYLFILHEMLQDPEQSIASLCRVIAERDDRQRITGADEDRARTTRNFLMELDFFKSLTGDALQRICRVAKLQLYFENDVIPSEAVKDAVMFLRKGRVSRNMDPGTGWFSTLDVAKEGQWLNETNLLPECKSRIELEVLSEQAEIVTIPLPYLQDVLHQDREVEHKMLIYVLREMEKYQRRWVNS